MLQPSVTAKTDEAAGEQVETTSTESLRSKIDWQRRLQRLKLVQPVLYSREFAARLLRDFVERPWARLNIRGAADVPETN